MPTPDAADDRADPPLPAPADGANNRPGDRRRLPDAARRALAEAAARRAERRNTEARTSHAADEIGGRDGLDPTRYGDWEVNGLASDF
ncbi:MAG: DUF1674 domain-containing protein [Xanthobacteraceae bacterium]|jgi:hypothetical protein